MSRSRNFPFLIKNVCFNKEERRSRREGRRGRKRKEIKEREERMEGEGREEVLKPVRAGCK